MKFNSESSSSLERIGHDSSPVAQPVSSLFRVLWRHALMVTTTLTLVACQSIPEGKTGDAADALANRMLRAANQSVWNSRVKAIEFRFREENSYFWDKERGLVEFRTGETVVQFSKNTLQAVGTEAGETLSGDDLKEAVLEAYANFTNDSFWVQPAFHIKSPGTELYAVDDSTLRVTYSSGGVTPGDTYVFHLDEEDRIEMMEMWVSILPFQGVDAPFHEYVEYAPGVTIAREREVLGVVTILIDEVKLHTDQNAANDRFGPLFEAHPGLK